MDNLFNYKVLFILLGDFYFIIYKIQIKTKLVNYKTLKFINIYIKSY